VIVCGVIYVSLYATTPPYTVILSSMCLHASLVKL